MRTERHGHATDAAALRARLRHVYWIGGGSGAGKSVIARRLAARYGLSLYATDDVMPDHARETRQLGLPVIEVDTAVTEEALQGRVAEAFGLGRAWEAGGQLDRRRQHEDGPNG